MLQESVKNNDITDTSTPNDNPTPPSSSIVSNRNRNRNRMNSNGRVQEILRALVTHEVQVEQVGVPDKLGVAWSKTKNYLYNRHDLQAEQVHKVLNFLDDGR
jgi:hypothetical protein